MTIVMTSEQPHADEFWSGQTELGDRLAKISALMFRAQYAGIWVQDREAKSDVLIGSFNIPANSDMGGFQAPKKFDDFFLFNVTPQILPDHPLVNGKIGDVRTVIFVPINLGHGHVATMSIGCEDEFSSLTTTQTAQLRRWINCVEGLYAKQISIVDMLRRTIELLTR
ncbi:hypothetical protein BVC71_14815 [Marivivens niveibacter]|uniref:GAF domain-containing protein n=1 Tax=Marivivens niveibacter TaxID=1930667 RepID=A0A251WUR5_9RHOB|nr:hypothetical protein [Marivivens niveibacter]OUD08229.1 hypothetical protein BVC71_14815 [Marivivens niveibacter]